MGTTQSKRLRLRIFPQDERALDEIPGKTTHTSKSNVIRVALVFFEQVWSSRLGGFQVVYRKKGSRERPDVLMPAIMRPETAKDEDGGKKPKTGKSIEIRLTNSDNERIENLLACEAADTYSEVVRRAIRLYAAAVSRCQEGWQVTAFSPSGDVLPLTVPGLGGSVAQHGKAAAVSESAVSSPWGAAGQRRTFDPACLLDLLPKSLADIVSKLAEAENCEAEILIVDLVRTEALARLEGRHPDEAVDETAETPTPGPPPEVLVQPESEADNAIIEEIVKTLDLMADNIEKTTQLFDKAGKTQAVSSQRRGEEQEDLSVLLSGGTEAEEPVSPMERLFARAREVNERLTALVALVEKSATRPKRKRKTARSQQEGEKERATPSEEDSGPRQTDIFADTAGPVDVETPNE